MKLPKMKLFALAAVVALAVPTAVQANTVGCGDNAFTYAEVVKAKPGLRTGGPITSVPDSLCADLIEDSRGRIDSLHVNVGDAARGVASSSTQHARRPAAAR